MAMDTSQVKGSWRPASDSGRRSLVKPWIRPPPWDEIEYGRFSLTLCLVSFSTLYGHRWILSVMITRFSEHVGLRSVPREWPQTQVHLSFVTYTAHKAWLQSNCVKVHVMEHKCFDVMKWRSSPCPTTVISTEGCRFFF